MKVINTTNPIAAARDRIRKAIATDPGYMEAWIANLAMFMYDNLDDDRLKDPAFRNEKAERLLELVFG